MIIESRTVTCDMGNCSNRHFVLTDDREYVLVETIKAGWDAVHSPLGYDWKTYCPTHRKEPLSVSIGHG